MTYLQMVEATNFLNQQTATFQPEIGIILGTGLGSLVHDINVEYTISYTEIPHFPISTVEFHSGKLFFGTLAGKRVICMQGRFHFYEGYHMQQVTFPVRVMKLLGVHTLLVSNAAGGMNPDFAISDLMVIQDHISFFLPGNPLIGKNFDEFGDRFPDMCDPYDLELVESARKIAVKHGIKLHTGVYVSVPGPQLETRAEYRLLRMMGGDAVGMSTVPEVIAARQMNIRCFGLSVITDMGIPETLEKADIVKIIDAAMKAEPHMTQLIKDLIENMD
ncbi:purine-nucleoside phosphorylase [Arundinibacter roseus]|uniref:Purine nucleoside phosphorylase n=1 Tax=Arundinibacter roseus TaxID=2070510 RepID=A0A4R4K9I4_9BACT|nr:purine-nucleoside phosphorylase [Arundinibacter roseus]TDB64464.1 purine-nucleoside phosphorylase [Arundinibacter roseus]